MPRMQRGKNELMRNIGISCSQSSALFRMNSHLANLVTALLPFTCKPRL